MAWDLKDIAKNLWDKENKKLKIPVEPVPFSVSLDKETKETIYITIGVLSFAIVTSALINNNKI